MKSTANENKTKSSAASVATFLASIKDDTRRTEVGVVIALMKRATKQPPRIWGSSIVGFGTYHYKYATGREGDWFVAGVSPRKANLTFYVLPGLHLHTSSLKALGAFTTGKSCIYVKRLSDVNLPILEKMVRQAVGDIKRLTVRKKAGA